MEEREYLRAGGQHFHIALKELGVPGRPNLVRIAFDDALKLAPRVFNAVGIKTLNQVIRDGFRESPNFIAIYGFPFEFGFD